MKHLRLFACAAALAVLCGCASTGASTASTRTSFPDNAFKEIPQEYMSVCDKGGVIRNFTYKTRDNQTAGSPEFEKSGLVYLPYGYDENDKSTRPNRGKTNMESTPNIGVLF